MVVFDATSTTVACGFTFVATLHVAVFEQPLLSTTMWLYPYGMYRASVATLMHAGRTEPELPASGLSSALASGTAAVATSATARTVKQLERRRTLRIPTQCAFLSFTASARVVVAQQSARLAQRCGFGAERVNEPLPHVRT